MNFFMNIFKVIGGLYLAALLGLLGLIFITKLMFVVV